MKNLILFLAICFLGTSASAQLNCSNVNAAISTSISGGTVTLTNNSTPTSTNNIYTNYHINWGDNSTTNVSTNAAQTHTYHTSGSYNIQMTSQVHDSINNITCYDTANTTVSITTSLNCNNINAQFYTYRTGNTSVVLVNQSTPNATNNLGVQYHIVWGDGNTTTTSSKQNQTHTYNSGGTYTIQLYLTVIDSNNNNTTCHDTATYTMFIPGSGLNCSSVNASFFTNSNLGTVSLVNMSTPNPGSGISATYLINWGDGNSTTATNKSTQTHTYTNSGNYTITLKATYVSGTLTCVDSTSDTVNINTTPPNVISGSIIVDSTSSNQRDTFKVWLITYDSQTNILAAIDSQIVSGYAYVPYAFNNITSGAYRTKAHHLNGPTSGQGYVPTYHDSDLLWSNANVINHTGVVSVANIYMKKGTVTTGPGFVGGNVQQGANKGTANGIEGMNVFLLDAGSNQLVAHAVTDANGDYEFNNVEYGSYYVHPEQLAYTTAQASIMVDANKMNVSGINFERSIKNKTITYKPASVATISGETMFSIYPNPASDVVNILWADATEKDATISITDISGKQVVNTTVKTNGVTTIDVSQLQTGFYMMKVTNGNNSHTQKLILQ